MSERGQAAPLALMAVLFAALLAVGVVRVGDAAGRGAAAQASADASALAGAADGEEAAVEVATANQARVVRFEQVGDDVRVIVERRGATATARARWQPAPIP
ncbi:MAG: hypothetical protein JWO77_1255 [Ilumatobacteraceae bacterium]|nr:hypothetical protein [Ilumatobacteraceae bacterium]